MREVVICEPVRSPVGRFGGVFKCVEAKNLAIQVLSKMMNRTGLSGEFVDDVILGQCYPTMDAPSIGRVVGLDSGLPHTAGGIQIDRRCGSGLQSVIYGIMQVASGGSDLVLAGGVESMSNAPIYNTSSRWGIGSGEGVLMKDSLLHGRINAGGDKYPIPGGMLETAENVRREYNISREAQDAYALLSQARAQRAKKLDLFKDEIIPITVRHKKENLTITDDEHPRPDTTLESLSKLRPILGHVDVEATVTAGNASGQNDGAAMCIVTTRKKAEEFELNPFLKLVSWSISGVRPEMMGMGPVPSTLKALKMVGLQLSDIDLIELNEAFASQVLACGQVLGLSDGDFDRINVNGSGISLGHPLGATGARILTTLAYEMKRRDVKYGLETMCIGGGQGLAAVFEKV
ncbi:acetyl-CoA C-acetyltransferase [Hirschia litorea]|uniref:Acetyl-CoA C-acetyltransferase n=1 Tax=Hirschia litorea TaxID=1199156 RepID=A0ABW2IJR0_9PROT